MLRTGDAFGGVYAELAPLPRHRALVDHIFILRDRGGLTGPKRSVFATPFCEIALVAAFPDQGSGDDGRMAWQVVQAPPRFGRQPRATSLHGWMVGVRADPLGAGLDGLPQALRERSGELTEIVVGEAGCDAIVAWLDDVLDAVIADTRGDEDMSMARSRQRDIVGAWRQALSARGAPRARTIARLADATDIAPRTLRRHVRSRAGLTPKRYATLRRFNAALHEVAGGDGSFAEVAMAAGYCDQSHMTADLAQHTGASPGRLRAFARCRSETDAAWFFKDPGVRARVTLFLAAQAVDDAMAGG